MKTLAKKTVLMGIVAGTVWAVGTVGGHAAQANEHAADVQHGQASVADESEASRNRPSRINIDEVAKKIAHRYGVNEDEVRAALQARRRFNDIDHAAMFAKITGRSFREVLAMKADWDDVQKALGITSEQMQTVMNEVMVTDMAERLHIDAGTINDLLKSGYQASDINIAGRLASESGKNIRAVLDMKKINNHWRDIAKALGVEPPKPGNDNETAG